MCETSGSDCVVFLMLSDCLVLAVAEVLAVMIAPSAARGGVVVEGGAVVAAVVCSG